MTIASSVARGTGALRDRGPGSTLEMREQGNSNTGQERVFPWLSLGVTASFPKEVQLTPTPAAHLTCTVSLRTESAWREVEPGSAAARKGHKAFLGIKDRGQARWKTTGPKSKGPGMLECVSSRMGRGPQAFC